MIIDWINFTPYSSLIGGILIGLAAVIVMLANGRIMGISGMASSLLIRKENKGSNWIIIFLFGTLVGPVIYTLFFGSFRSEMVTTTPYLLLAGIFVGIGTYLGNGCTSGHGICGLSRFSIRSLFATITFVFTGIITVYLIGQLT